MSDPFVPARSPAPGQQRGQLRVETDIAQQGSVDREGLSGGLSAFAAGFAQAGARIGAIADHAAAKEGTEAGRIAGLDPEFRPTRALTIRGEAYDKAGLEIYGARVKTAFAADLDAVYDAHKGDPQALSAALEAKRNSWVGESLEEVRPELELVYEKSRFAYLRQAAREQHARITAEHKASLETELAQVLKEGQQRSYAMGLDATAAEARGSDLASIERTLRRKGLDGTPFFTADEIRTKLANAQAEMTDSALIGAFDRTEGLEAKAAFIEKFKEDFAGSQGLAAEYDFDGFETITGKMETSLSKEVTARNKLVREATKEIESVERRAKKGFSIPAEEMAAIEAGVAVAADPQVAGALQNAKSLLALQERARILTPAQLDRAIANGRAQMQAGGATEQQVAQLDMLESLESEMRGALKDDPLGWADRVGIVPVPPLQLTGEIEAGTGRRANTALASFRQRMAIGDEVSARYGIPPVYLRPDEEQMFTSIMAEGGNSLLSAARLIYEGAGPERASAVFAQLGKNAPALAMIGGVIAELGDTASVRDAAEAIALRRLPEYKPLHRPTPDEATNAAVSALGNALGFMPQAQSALIDLVNAAYERRADRRQITDFDSGLWTKTARELLGERVANDGETYGGIYNQNGWFDGIGDHMIVLPPRLRRDGFDEFLMAIRDEDLEAAGVTLPVADDGKPFGLSRIKAATFVTAGSGVYAVALNDPNGSDPMWLPDDTQPDGKWRFDLNRVIDVIEKRRPDLVHGGPPGLAPFPFIPMRQLTP